MESAFDVLHPCSVKYQESDALSGLTAKRTDESDINDEISIMLSPRANRRDSATSRTTF